MAHLELGFSVQDWGCHPTGVPGAGAHAEYSSPPAPLQASSRDGKVAGMALSQVLCKEDAQSSAKGVSDQGFQPCHSLVP